MHNISPRHRSHLHRESNPNPEKAGNYIKHQQNENEENERKENETRHGSKAQSCRQPQLFHNLHANEQKCVCRPD